MAIRSIIALAGVASLLLLVPSGVAAQDYLRSFETDPILVYNGDGHRSPVFALLYTPDGKQLLTGGLDKSVLIWNLAENPPRLASESLRPLVWKNKLGRIYAMAYSPAAGGADAGSGRLILGGQGIEAGGGTLSVFRYPAAAAGDRRDTGDLLTHWIGDVPPGARTPLGHLNTVVDLAFDPTGKLVASASNDEANPIQIWDAARGTPVRRLKDPQGNPKFRATRVVFTPDGSQLIAASHADSDNPDGFIRIWNLRAPAGGPADSQPTRVSIHGVNQRFPTAIRALAVSPDGRWLVAGLEAPIAAPAPAPAGERSGLVLIDLKAPQGLVPRLLPFRRPDADPASKAPFLGQVLDLKFIDARRIAVAALTTVVTPGQDPNAHRSPLATWIQVRSVPDGKVLENVVEAAPQPPKPWPGLIRALAVRPDGNQLAFADGERNRVFLKDLGQPGQPAAAIVAEAAVGGSNWRVGFVQDNPAPSIPRIAYSQVNPGEPGGAATPFTGFDLDTLQPVADPIPTNRVAKAIATYNGYSIRRPADNNPFQLDLVAPNRAVQPIRLDRGRHGRWWSWTFIPPAASHPKPCLAIACEFGVVIYTLDDLTACKRFLDGHSADVLDAAPDPTGQWLITGSADQTVRLWSLDHCDRTRPFGARFRRAERGWIVDQVAERSPADLQGLRRGDYYKAARKESTPVAEQGGPGPALDAAEPGPRLALDYNRPLLNSQEALYRQVMKDSQTNLRFLARETLVVRKADSPLLTLFRAGQDWVVWMPQGYYETSVQGDRFYLGWHLNNNPSDILRRPADQPRRTAFVPMITFQDRLRRPDVLWRLLQTGSLIQALPREPRGPVLTGRPPPPPIGPSDMPMLATIEPRPVQPGDITRIPGQDFVRVNVARLPVQLRIEGRPGQRPTRVRVLDNGRVEQDIANPVLNGQDRFDLAFQIAPGHRSRKTVEVTADNGRVSEVDWEYERPAPPIRDGRLIVLAYGPSFDQLENYRLAQAPRDAQLASIGLGKMIVLPHSPPERYRNSTVTWIHNDASEDDLTDDASSSPDAGMLRAALQKLEGEVEAGRLGWPDRQEPGNPPDDAPGRVDTVVLFLNTHLLAEDTRELILGEANDEYGLVHDAINAEEVARSLGNLVRHGCRVVVFVDGIHRPSDRDRTFDVREWIRQLQAERVATYSASGDRRPSMVLGGQNGAFAQGIGKVADGDRGDRYATESSLTSEMLAESLFEKVQSATRKAQNPHFYGSRTSWDFLPFVGWTTDR